MPSTPIDALIVAPAPRSKVTEHLRVHGGSGRDASVRNRGSRHRPSMYVRRGASRTSPRETTLEKRVASAQTLGPAADKSRSSSSASGWWVAFEDANTSRASGGGPVQWLVTTSERALPGREPAITREHDVAHGHVGAHAGWGGRRTMRPARGDPAVVFEEVLSRAAARREDREQGRRPETPPAR